MRTTDAQVELVRALIESVPAGRVVTYGDLATAAGLSTPRTVAWILRTDGAGLPWQRVVPASGRPVAHLLHRQLGLLRAEGCPVRDDRVELKTARWPLPEPAHTAPPGHTDPSGTAHIGTATTGTITTGTDPGNSA